MARYILQTEVFQKSSRASLSWIFWQHPECYERQVTVSNVDDDDDHVDHVCLQVGLLEIV